ncbi:MAG: hypothetical protein ACOYOB_20100, partial [Myxococcota bacterium]
KEEAARIVGLAHTCEQGAALRIVLDLLLESASLALTDDTMASRRKARHSLGLLTMTYEKWLNARADVPR